jgi:peptidoglycan/LPS O-acetylase OafA/YrhL
VSGAPIETGFTEAASARLQAQSAPSGTLGGQVHLPALDGARGLAILLVLVFHLTLYGLALPSGTAGKALYRIALSGWIGVDLFFVLSGFLITGILYDAKGKDHYLRNFYARRCLRIFPLYFGVLAIALVFLPLAFPKHAGLQALTSNSGWYWTYTTNVMIARGGWPDFGALGHFWSLAVEEQFYLLWPFVVLLLNRRKLMGLCIACILLSLCVRMELHDWGRRAAASVLMPARVDALAAGGLVALLHRGPTGLSGYRRHSLWVALGCGLALAGLGLRYREFNVSHEPILTVGFTMLALFFASLLVLLLSCGPHHPVGRVFRSAGLRFFGRYSYGLYVFHHPLLFITTPSAVAAALPWLPGGELGSRLVMVGGVAVLSLGLTLLSWHLVEQHFLRLKSWFR